MDSLQCTLPGGRLRKWHMSRTYAYRRKPDEADQSAIDELPNLRLLLLQVPPRCTPAVQPDANSDGMPQTPGPTSFVVKASEGDDKKYKISIGDIQKCSCGPPGTGLCVHLYFVRTTYFTHTLPLSFYLRALGPSRTLLHPTRSSRSTLSSLTGPPGDAESAPSTAGESPVVAVVTHRWRSRECAANEVQCPAKVTKNQKDSCSRHWTGGREARGTDCAAALLARCCVNSQFIHPIARII